MVVLLFVYLRKVYLVIFIDVPSTSGTNATASSSGHSAHAAARPRAARPRATCPDAARPCAARLDSASPAVQPDAGHPVPADVPSLGATVTAVSTPIAIQPAGKVHNPLLTTIAYWLLMHEM